MASIPNWHFDYLAPVYDYLSLSRDEELILQALDIKKGDKVLDLAGGTGEFLNSVSTKTTVDHGGFFLVDRSESMLEIAGQKDLDNLILSSASHLPLQSSSINSIFIGDAVHHISDLSGTFHEINRILAPGGRLVIEEFDPETVLGGILYWLESLSGMKSQFLSPSDLKSKLKAVDLNVVDFTQDGFVYYFVLEKGY